MNDHTSTAVDGVAESGGMDTSRASASRGIEAEELSESVASSEPDSDAPDAPVSGRLPLDETFEVLRNQRRRYVMQYLEERAGEVSLSDLAEQIAAWENDKEVGAITSSERKRVYVGLYQCHLPKMDGMGVISFNKPRGLIERGPNAPAVEPYLEGARESTERRGRVGPAVGLSVVGLVGPPVAILMLWQSTAALALALSMVALVTVASAVALRKGWATRTDQ